jgi:hypothetical protein
MRESVTLRCFDDAVKADLARVVLESAGIRAWLENDHLVGANWGNNNGQIRLQVHSADLKAAEKALNDNTQAEFPDEEEHEVFDSTEPVRRDDYPRELTRREEDAKWALTLAAFGLLLCPLQVIAPLVLLKVALSRQRLDAPYRRKAWIAAALTAPLIAFGVFIVGMIAFDGWQASQRPPPNPPGEMAERILQNLFGDDRRLPGGSPRPSRPR